jgi:hypothetical protein
MTERPGSQVLGDTASIHLYIDLLHNDYAPISQTSRIERYEGISSTEPKALQESDTRNDRQLL